MHKISEADIADTKSFGLVPGLYFLLPMSGKSKRVMLCFWLRAHFLPLEEVSGLRIPSVYIMVCKSIRQVVYHSESSDCSCLI